MFHRNQYIIFASCGGRTAFLKVLGGIRSTDWDLSCGVALRLEVLTKILLMGLGFNFHRAQYIVLLCHQLASQPTKQSGRDQLVGPDISVEAYKSKREFTKKEHSSRGTGHIQNGFRDNVLSNFG